MNAVILCPGPSLADFGDYGGDLVIGVNRAATRHPCDAWAGCDLPMVVRYGDAVLGSPTLIASADAIDNLRDRKAAWRGPTFDRREMLAYCPHAMDWVMFSATTALVYAAYRGATRVDVYGADWKADAPDFDGVPAGANRSADRFALERGIWQDRLVPWLAARGVEVVRHASHA